VFLSTATVFATVEETTTMISLFKRGCIYYARLWIPDDVRCYIQKREIWASLRTKSHQQAKILAKAVHYNAEVLYAQIRSGMLTDTQIKLIVKEHLTNTLKGREFIRTRGILTTLPKDTETIPPMSEWRDSAISTFHQVIDQSKLQLFNNDFSTIKAHVNQTLERSNIAYDENSPEYTKLCREFIKAEIAISKIELERLDGNYDNKFDGFLDSILPAENIQVIAPVENEPGMLLSELIAEHIKEAQQAESWTDKTYAENDSIYKVFLEVMGDRDIATITHKDLISFRDKLVKLPANRGKNAELRDKTIAQIMAMKNVRAMSVSTVNKYLSRVSSLFKWASKHSYISTNYAEGLSLPKSKRADQEREAYSEDDIKKLITNLTNDSGKPERYWIPLIALYQGMRLEEICQLHLADIIEKDGITCFNICEGETKRVKTLSSRRIIPMHPRLISLGLLDYIQALRKSKAIRLWKNLTKGRDGYSHVFGKWYQRFNRDYVTDNPKRV
jgi:integrase